MKKIYALLAVLALMFVGSGSASAATYNAGYVWDDADYAGTNAPIVWNYVGDCSPSITYLTANPRVGASSFWITANSNVVNCTHWTGYRGPSTKLQQCGTGTLVLYHAVKGVRNLGSCNDQMTYLRIS